MLDAAAGQVGGVDLAVAGVDGRAPGVERGAQEAGDRQAGDRGRVLEGQEEAQPGALVGRQLEDVAGPSR